jgi:hypothetical protein
MTRQGLALCMGVLVGLLWGCMMGSPNPTNVSEAVSVSDMSPTPIIFDSSHLPPVTPVKEAEPSRCPKAPRSHLIINERGRVTDNGKTLNIRTSAGTQYQQIGQMPPGSVFFVVDGPRCSGEYAWFYIRYEGMDGWIAEADTEVVYAEPYLDG